MTNKNGISKEFAELLYLSNITEDFKQEILDILPDLNQTQMKEMYKSLKIEESKRKCMGLKVDLDLNNI